MSDSVTKDPQALLDYLFDWTSWLSADSDTIVSQSITVDTGLTLVTSTITGAGTGVTVWLSGGTVGNEYSVDCLITTNGGRQDSRKMTILIQDK